MTPERLILSSVAARLDAGTYQPRGPRQPSHVPARLVRRARLVAVLDEVLAPLAACLALAFLTVACIALCAL
jgi:hypothetical protein